MARVPSLRIRAANEAPLRAEGQFVLYWMTAARRAQYNFALDRAIEHAQELDKPLVVLEGLRAGYRWASDRLHAFMLQGMADNAARFAAAGVTHHPYVELASGDGGGLLDALAASAAVVITDDFPCFFLPHMLESAARRLPIRVEAVDGNGLLPMAAGGRLFSRAVDMRRHLQRALPAHLSEMPSAEPLRRARSLPRLAELPERITRRWPRASDALLDASGLELARLGIDHGVGVVKERGGAAAGSRLLRRFVRERLSNYALDRSHPDAKAASGLSPYLHFGQVSAHQVLAAIADHEEWTAASVSSRASGAKEGWWGMSQNAEAFLDELVTWRELGLNFCHYRSDYDRYESLPEWARQTLEQHASDPRPHVYALGQLERAETHDALWNAAQRQLLVEGRMENYLRMLWGKKILEWSPAPRDALEAMIELNNKYALDGRDPNSYSGIFWCLGRYDRPWAPVRPIFGSVRYMSSQSTMKKLRVRDYVATWSSPGPQTRLF